MAEWTHFDDAGQVRMVDVSAKPVTPRVAVASGLVRMAPETLAKIVDGSASRKGNVLEVARLAGIMAAKRTADWIPLCHPLPLEEVAVEIVALPPGELQVRATCRVHARTGVEMEALTAVAAACLTVYDMCKALDRGMEIAAVRLDAKSGGRSGEFVRGAADAG